MISKVSIDNSYRTMFHFLDKYWVLTKDSAGRIASLLGGISYTLFVDPNNPSLQSSDPAMLGEWMEEVNKLNTNNDESLSYKDAFSAMFYFIYKKYDLYGFDDDHMTVLVKKLEKTCQNYEKDHSDLKKIWEETIAEVEKVYPDKQSVISGI